MHTNDYSTGDDRQQIDALGKIYLIEFARKFNIAPPKPTSGEDYDILRWAIKEFGFEKACKLIRRFFLVSDEWIEKNGWNLRSFKHKIELVLIEEGKLHQKVPFHKTIRLLFSCDNCFNHHYIDVPMNHNWSSKILCPNCSETEKP